MSQDTPEPNNPPDAGTVEGEAPGGAVERSPEQPEAAATRGSDNAAGQRTGRGRHVLGGTALAIALLAASTAGWLWWQYRQFDVSLDRADQASAAAVQEVRATLQSLGDRLELLQDADALARDAAAELNRRLDDVPGRFQALEQRVNALQGISGDARRRWMRAEAEYYLAVANTELALAGRWPNAIAALELADAKLRELGSPALGVVRARIAEELRALRAVRLPDVEGLSYSLASLIQSVEALPMRTGAPTSFVTEDEALQTAEPGLSRVWLSLRQAVTGMIRVQRSDAPSYRALTAEEQALVRRQLELELELARLGLVRGQAAVFQTSLSAASALLTREFDTAASTVQSAVSLIEELTGLEVEPARPDISGSLTLLRGLADRDG